MIKNYKHALEVQQRRVKAGKFGIAKAVKRFLARGHSLMFASEFPHNVDPGIAERIQARAEAAAAARAKADSDTHVRNLIEEFIK